MNESSKRVVSSLREPRESVSSKLDEFREWSPETLSDDEVTELTEQLDREQTPVPADD